MYRWLKKNDCAEADREAEQLESEIADLERRITAAESVLDAPEADIPTRHTPEPQDVPEMAVEAAPEGFLGRLGRKWTENREKASQRAAERAKTAFQQTLGGVIQGYAAVARQWIELHFAATVNGTRKDQAEFDPLRKALS